MKFFLTLALFSLASFPVLAMTSMEAEEQYHAFSEDLKAGEVLLDLIDGTVLSHHHKKILVDSLWDYVIDPANSKNLLSALKVWKSLDFNLMPLPEQVRLYLLGLTLQGSPSRLENMKSVLLNKIKGKLNNRTLIILFNHSQVLRENGLDVNLDEVEMTNLKFKVEYDVITKSSRENVSEQDIQEILAIKASAKSVIYLACHTDRNYPCLIILRDKKGALLRNEDGSFPTLPALAKSKFELPFNFENGHTPTGLYHVESVMPQTDRQQEYGRNRRLILKMAGKTDALMILPSSQHKKAWWRQVLLARELGRENLRIHGSGKVNTDPLTFHPELVPSSGCIKVREGTYNGNTYNDQRVLLNTLMKAQGLKVTRSNEVSIMAHLLVFNVPGSGPVTIDEIKEYLGLQE